MKACGDLNYHFPHSLLMTKLRIEMLGSLQVTVGGKPALFRTDAERALLAYLAAQQGIPQRRDTLTALLSPDRPDSDALTYLRNRLTRLRDALDDNEATPPWLDVDRKQIILRKGGDILVDLTQFEQQLTTVETHPHRQLTGCPTCLAHLQAAVDLVRGEFLAGLNFPSDTWEAWLLSQREHLHQRALAALTLLRDARLARGEWAAALDLAQRQLTLEPWLEAAHRALMTAHVQLGDRNAALAQYEQCERVLWDELGVEPEEETQQLQQRLLEQPLSHDRLAAIGEAAVPDNLPSYTGRFWGRVVEQRHLLQRLADKHTRLVTLVGPGGSGKTRLAIEVGQALKTSFPDGVWFVALAAVKGDPAQMTEQIKIAVGEAAGFGQGDKQLTGEQVLAILRDKRLLLILDNCEVVLNELGFIPGWLKRAPGVVMLATAREPLNFTAEVVVLLEGLPTGEGETGSELRAAEALFAERGQMARTDFVVSAENLSQVRQICRLVDGLPLGIALAAAWVRRRSLAQISESIGQSLDFLNTELRDVDPRHRSMRAVLATSWQLLDAPAQAVLAALAVFPASFSAEAASAVAGATLGDLDLLCEKSLLQQQQEAQRYSLHSLVRQFAEEKRATRTGAIERAFVDYFYEFARTHQTDYAALQPEWPNLAAAISKAHGQATWQIVLDFVQVLDEPWFRQIRFTELRAGLMAALDAATALADEAALVRTLLRLGEIEVEQNEYGVAEGHLRAAIDGFMHLEESVGIAHATYLLGRIKLEQAEDGQALRLTTASLQIFEAEDDRLGIAKNLNQLALLQIKTNRDFTGAHTHLVRSIAMQRELPPSPYYVEALCHLARVKRMGGADTEAEALLLEAAAISRGQASLGDYAAVLYEQLLLYKVRRQVEQALAFGYECLASFQRLGSVRWEGLVKTQLGLLHQAKAELPRAVTLLQEGLQIFAELGDPYEQAYSHYYLSMLYAQMNEMVQSHAAKEQVRWLNQSLQEPQLAQWLHQAAA